MAKKVEIEIEILKDGQVRCHVKGRKGPSCLEFLDVLSEKLGKIEHRELTSEYYEESHDETSIETGSDTGK